MAALATLTACSETPVEPASAPNPSASVAPGGLAEKASVCHLGGARPRILEVSGSAVAGHLAHGDYLTTLRVRREAESAEEGSHYRRIGDALEAVRAGRLARGELQSGACRITILISAESYPGSTTPEAPEHERFPLIVDVPDITLRGALVMQVDANGRAAGATPGHGETVLVPTVPLPVIDAVSVPIILANAHPAGSAGHGLSVEGLVFRSGHDAGLSAGGQGVLSVRAERVTLSGNRFESGFTESIDVRGGSAAVVLNQLAGTAGTCDICLAGPGRFRAVGNQLAAGGIPGIVVGGVIGLPVPAGVEPVVIPAAAETWAELRNNEVRDHQRLPVGVGIRVDAVGVGAPNVHNMVTAVIQDNVLVGNRFGIIVHAAFPVAGSALRSDVTVTLGRNTIGNSCQAKLLVSLSRHTAALGLTTPPYLRNSTFRLTLGGDLAWSEAWFGHPDGFGNTLVVDGDTIAHGNRHFYDAAACTSF